MADQDRRVIEEMLREAEQDADQESVAQKRQQTARHRPWRRLANWVKDHKKTTIAGVVVAVGVASALIPATRYAVAGLVVRRDVTVYVMDAQTNQAVSGAEVTIQGATAKTDSTGTVTIHRIKPGHATVAVTKKYYQGTSQIVTVGLQTTHTVSIALTATGRQVPVRVTNKITGQGLGGVTISAAGTEAQTNEQGETTLVVDAAAATVATQLNADGYNAEKVNLTVSQQVTANSFTMTPTGSVYFLSKRSGTIDVVKTDLDGLHRTVVVAGTGNEENNHTALLASHDWKFLVLLARRDGDRAALYLIDTSDSKLTQIDTNNATFQPVGWSGHRFVYSTHSNVVADWQSGQSQLKTFDADTGTLTVIDQTQASGSNYADYVAEQFSDLYLLKDTIVYAKNWQGTGKDLAAKKPAVYTSAIDKPEKKLQKSFDPALLTVVQPAPLEVYIQQTKPDGSTKFFVYANGNIQPKSDLTATTFNAYHPAYVFSPDNNHVAWYEPRGSQYSVYMGDSTGQSKRDIFDTQQAYVPYGWYDEAYVLLSKNRSELYIAPADTELQAATLQKIADYHAPPPGLARGGYGGM